MTTDTLLTMMCPATRFNGSTTKPGLLDPLYRSPVSEHADDLASTQNSAGDR